MKKELFHGILLINKAQKFTSHDVVQKIRHLFSQKSVGHAGTLDPMAEGLLVILLGSATKLSSYLLNADKTYRLKMKFGLMTDSYDKDGEVLQDKKVSLKKEEIEEAINKKIGDLELKVPLFSAVKIKGKKLYNYAREGQDVERPLKKMSFYDLKIHHVTEDEAEVSVSCSKGAYIRAWVHSIGEDLKTGACLVSLQRMFSGNLSLSNGLSFDELEQKHSKETPTNNEELKEILGDAFLYPSESLPQFPFLELTQRDTKSLLQGRIPPHIITESEEDQIKVNREGSSQILKITQGNHLVALLELNPFERVKILKNFPYNNHEMRKI